MLSTCIHWELMTSLAYMTIYNLLTRGCHTNTLQWCDLKNQAIKKDSSVDSGSVIQQHHLIIQNGIEFFVIQVSANTNFGCVSRSNISQELFLLGPALTTVADCNTM